MNKISRKNWTDSFHKWRVIVNNIKDPSRRRYVDTRMSGRCGYCKAVCVCSDCNLHPNICSGAVPDTVFKKLYQLIYKINEAAINEGLRVQTYIRKKDIHWDLALKYAEQILEAIKADEVNVYE